MYLSLCSDREAVFRNSSAIQEQASLPRASTPSVILVNKGQHSAHEKHQSKKHSAFIAAFSYTHVLQQQKKGRGYNPSSDVGTSRPCAHSHLSSFPAVSFHKSSHWRFLRCPLPSNEDSLHFCTFGLIRVGVFRFQTCEHAWIPLYADIEFYFSQLHFLSLLPPKVK
jgi:hypothetical protein